MITTTRSSISILASMIAISCSPIEQPFEICWIEEDSYNGAKYGSLETPEETCVVIPVSRIPPRVIVVRIDGVDQNPGPTHPSQPGYPHSRGPTAVSAGSGAASIVGPGIAISAAGGTASIASLASGSHGGNQGPTAASAGGGEASVANAGSAASGADGTASVVSISESGTAIAVSAEGGIASIAVID